MLRNPYKVEELYTKLSSIKVSEQNLQLLKELYTECKLVRADFIMEEKAIWDVYNSATGKRNGSTELSLVVVWPLRDC